MEDTTRSTREKTTSDRESKRNKVRSEDRVMMSQPHSSVWTRCTVVPGHWKTAPWSSTSKTDRHPTPTVPSLWQVLVTSLPVDTTLWSVDSPHPVVSGHHPVVSGCTSPCGQWMHPSSRGYFIYLTIQPPYCLDIEPQWGTINNRTSRLLYSTE